MLIDVVMLISGLSDEALKRREKALKSLASTGTEVRLVLTERAPPSVESLAEMELAAQGILKRVTMSEKEGADAVIIWGGHDPSLAAARELVSIPVVGPGMASMLIASALAENFSLLVQLPGVVSIARRQVRDLGLERKCAGIYPVGLPVLELGKPESYNRVRETAVTSIEEGGADAVCFGCMALNDHAPRLSHSLGESHPGVIVIHPGLTSIRLAELLVEMGLSHSKSSYPHPPKEIVFGL
ncbi:MAG: aspartate/glutamate racemase family protein [Candidatus Bathyarchaeota archaeon]|jgi:allantoin racemase